MKFQAQLTGAEPRSIKASIEGHDFGVVGYIREDGLMIIDLPDMVETQYLSERMPGLFGGTLVVEGLAAKKDGKPLYIVYVNQNLGDYPAGWSFANSDHHPITEEEAKTYEWSVE